MDKLLFSRLGDKMKQDFKQIGMMILILAIIFSIPFIMLFGVNKWITTCDNVNWDNSIQTIHSIFPLKYLDIKLTCDSSDKSIMAFAKVSRAVTFNLIK